MTTFRQIGAGLAFVCAALSISGCVQTSSAPAQIRADRAASPEAREQQIQFAVEDLRFDAVIAAPSAPDRNRWGVLLIGGGMGNDLNWTVPGSLRIGDADTQVTVSGDPHEDAPAISRALVSRGFTVMRWSTIAQGDDLADQWPLRATPRTQRELIQQAEAALATLRATGLIETDRVILLGHSLGSARACTIAATDDGIRSLILLAPAYFSRDVAHSKRLDSEGLRYAEDVLSDRCMPCLTLFGSLDTSKAVSASHALTFAQKAICPKLEVRVFEDLGHQLGIQEGSLIAPIAEDVLAQLSEWAGQVAAPP